MQTKHANYKWEATTLEGFIQQLAVGYVARGYFFYVTGSVPKRISAAEHDHRMLQKFDVARSKWSRYRRKRRLGPSGWPLANVQYLRHGDFWVLLATPGEHRFFEEHRQGHTRPWLSEAQYGDVREVPIAYGGYSVGWRDKVSVRISPRAYRELKSYFLHQAPKGSKTSLEREFRRGPFEPYRGVTQQMLAILRAVNRVRKTAGLPLIDRESIRFRRHIVKPFDVGESGRDLKGEALVPLAA